MCCVDQHGKGQLREAEYTFLYSLNIIEASQISRGFVSEIFEMEVLTFELEQTWFYVNPQILFHPSSLV